MEPYYFMDGLTVMENRDNLSLHDLYSASPDGFAGGTDGEHISMFKGSLVHFQIKQKLFFDIDGNPIVLFNY